MLIMLPFLTVCDHVGREVLLQIDYCMPSRGAELLEGHTKIPVPAALPK